MPAFRCALFSDFSRRNCCSSLHCCCSCWQTANQQNYDKQLQVKGATRKDNKKVKNQIERTDQLCRKVCSPPCLPGLRVYDGIRDMKIQRILIQYKIIFYYYFPSKLQNRKKTKQQRRRKKRKGKWQKNEILIKSSKIFAHVYSSLLKLLIFIRAGLFILLLTLSQENAGTHTHQPAAHVYVCENVKVTGLFPNSPAWLRLQSVS